MSNRQGGQVGKIEIGSRRALLNRGDSVIYLQIVRQITRLGEHIPVNRFLQIPASALTHRLIEGSTSCLGRNG